MHASLAKSTWQKYDSAWAALEAYEPYVKKKLVLPLSYNTIRGYVAFLFKIRGLKPSSIKAYLASLSCLHKLKGYPNYELTDDVLRCIMKGAENLHMAAPPGKPNLRRVMTVSLLRYLGHKLATSDWDKATKQSLWAASLVAFFGAARMGELLAEAENWSDPTSTLTWSCVKYRAKLDSFLLHIKLAKMRTTEGEFIYLFPFKKISGLCPVNALKKQKALQQSLGKGKPVDPVFTNPSGVFITREIFNKALRTLLGDVVDFKKNTISCHSFRAGLPSLIAQFPELMSLEDIKNWGRWSGEAYARYTRLGDTRKRKIFDIITSVIN